MLQLKTTGIKEFIFPMDNAVEEECQTGTFCDKYFSEFQLGNIAPKIKEGQEPTRFMIKGLSAQVYDRVREVMDKSEWVQMERLCLQYGCVDIKNFIDDKGKVVTIELENGLYGKCLPAEVIDALGFFSQLRTALASAILKITRSQL
jgi:hypothetical protein